jgi:redox-sensitive bicupin YhaK (pirin superfamily)
MEHHDSSGGHGHLRAGGVQWMTAGSGIVHAEYREREFVKRGGTLEGVQLWVNLPRKFKMEAPHYQDLPAERIPVARFEGGEARVVAGELFGVAGPAQTYTPMIVAHLKLAGGADAEFAVPAGFNSFVYAIRGSGRTSSLRFAGNQLVEFRADGGSVQVTAEEPLDLLFLAGEPIDEPVVSWGPFVMNTREEIIQARDDYLAGRMGRLDERE